MAAAFKTSFDCGESSKRRLLGKFVSSGRRFGRHYCSTQSGA
jgi:hypothetical protein